MSESVMILPPNCGRNQDIQRCDTGTPRQVIADRKPFGVLVEHRIDDMDKRFVRRNKAVSSCEKVALKHAFDRVLTQHLDDSAIGRKLSTVLVFRKVIGD